MAKRSGGGAAPRRARPGPPRRPSPRGADGRTGPLRLRHPDRRSGRTGRRRRSDRLVRLRRRAPRRRARAAPRRSPWPFRAGSLSPWPREPSPPSGRAWRPWWPSGPSAAPPPRIRRPPRRPSRTAQHHLDMLLSALLSAGDATEALGEGPGEHPARERAPDPGPHEAARGGAPQGHAGPGDEPRRRGGRYVGRRVPGLGRPPRAGVGRGPGLRARLRPFSEVPRAAPCPCSAPGRAAPRTSAGRTPPRRVSLSPGDALLLGTPALAKGATSAWAGLSTLWPPFPDGFASGETARDLLRRAERWGETEPLHFAGPLGFALLLAR